MASGGVDAYRYSALMDILREIGETYNLPVPYGCQILYVERVEPDGP